MSKSDEKKNETTESEHEQGPHTVEESATVPSERDPSVNVGTTEYPPKPTDGKS